MYLEVFTLEEAEKELGDFLLNGVKSILM